MIEIWVKFFNIFYFSYIYCSIACKYVLNEIIVTEYPGPAYRIDDLFWIKNPNELEVIKKEKKLKNFLKKNNLKINDINQPILIHKEILKTNKNNNHHQNNNRNNNSSAVRDNNNQNNK